MRFTYVKIDLTNFGGLKYEKQKNKTVLYTTTYYRL